MLFIYIVPVFAIKIIISTWFETPLAYIHIHICISTMNFSSIFSYGYKYRDGVVCLKPRLSALHRIIPLLIHFFYIIYAIITTIYVQTICNLIRYTLFHTYNICCISNYVELHRAIFYTIIAYLKKVLTQRYIIKFTLWFLLFLIIYKLLLLLLSYYDLAHVKCSHLQTVNKFVSLIPCSETLLLRKYQ